MIFVNSFMWVLTHMPNQGAQPCNQGAVEFPLISLVLILRRLLDIRDIGRIFGDPAGINIFSIFRAIFKDFGLHLALSGKS